MHLQRGLQTLSNGWLDTHISHARNALETMRPSEREALLLRFGAQLSFEQLAESFDIAPPAARKRVSRAIASLRTALVETENAHDTQGGRA